MWIDPSSLSPPERVLWDAGVTQPEHIDLEAIASARGARVVFRPLDGCAARLVASSSGAVISVNADDYQGRKRFSLAHELAHWICDRKTGSFLCAKSDIGPQNAEAKSVEAHANGYASQLILPDYLVAPWAAGKRATLDVATALAKDFDASLTAAAIKLCKRAATPCCIACHNSTRLAWHQRSSSFPAEFYIKPELHQETDAFDMAYGKDGGKSRPKREAADRWISGRDVWGKTVETQSLKLPDGTVLTMIALVK
jgi:Zn-dependent peptidase ImmA (M78 family)